MKSRVWKADYSVTHHCCFQESVMLFSEPLTEEEAKKHIDYSEQMDNRIGASNLFETLGISDECLENLILWLRGVYDS